MGNLFSHTSSSSSKRRAKRKQPDVSEHDRAVLALKVQRKKLEDQRSLLIKRIETYQDAAAELVRENKSSSALLVLKKKKMEEGGLLRLDNMLLDVEGMVNNMESGKHMAKTLAVMQQGSEMLKRLQQQMPVEEVQRLMEDTAEAKAYQDQMNAILGQSLTPEEDEAAQQELDMLEEQMHLQEKLAMPTVPNDKVPTAVAASTGEQQQAQAQQGQEVDASAAAEAEAEAIAVPIAVAEKPMPSPPATAVPVAEEPLPSPPATTVPVAEEPLPSPPAMAVPVAEEPLPSPPAVPQQQQQQKEGKQKAPAKQEAEEEEEEEDTRVPVLA